MYIEGISERETTRTNYLDPDTMEQQNISDAPTNQPPFKRKNKLLYQYHPFFWRESEVSLDILCWKNMNMDGHELKSKVYY